MSNFKRMAKEILLGKSLMELKEFCLSLGMPAFTAQQIANWIYQKKVKDISLMSNISLKNREILKEHALIGCHTPIQRQQSSDGTEKFLFPTPLSHTGGESETDRYVESVYIPEDERATLCVSSQSGCRMNCAFCATGSQGFNHHLAAHEILNQFYSIPYTDKLSNIVLMGMGEPLDNTDEVIRALQAFTSNWGFAWSPYRITLSTVGILPNLPRFLNETSCHLAISLHSPFHNERAGLMPVERSYPIQEIIQLLHQYDWHRQRRVSFEYILIKDLNDSREHALATARLLKDLECRVNLISYHHVPGKDYEKTTQARTLAFQQTLQEKGIICTLRKSRGEDIMAACGLLAKTKGKA